MNQTPITLRDRYTRRDIQRAALAAARRAICRDCATADGRPRGRSRLIGWDIIFNAGGVPCPVELLAYARCPAGHVGTAYVTL
jgi:hypothetical protein